MAEALIDRRLWHIPWSNGRVLGGTGDNGKGLEKCEIMAECLEGQEIMVGALGELQDNGRGLRGT